MEMSVFPTNFNALNEKDTTQVLAAYWNDRNDPRVMREWYTFLLLCQDLEYFSENDHLNRKMTVQEKTDLIEARQKSLILRARNWLLVLDGELPEDDWKGSEARKWAENNLLTPENRGSAERLRDTYLDLQQEWEMNGKPV